MHQRVCVIGENILFIYDNSFDAEPRADIYYIKTSRAIPTFDCLYQPSVDALWRRHSTRLPSYAQGCDALDRTGRCPLFELDFTRPPPLPYYIHRREGQRRTVKPKIATTTAVTTLTGPPGCFPGSRRANPVLRARIIVFDIDYFSLKT